jgi:DNA replication and repair protein RecF
MVQFKNYDLLSQAFVHKVTGICGSNGVGKTNLLDAIYYLCFTKSYFTKTDNLVTRHGMEGFRLEGAFNRTTGPEKIVAVLRETGRKEFGVNGENYPKFSAHIGRCPCVMIAPDDVELITGGSEERRRFIDTLLSQVDPEYLQSLITYTKVMQQRNSLLKSFAESGRRDHALLEVLDQQLIPPGIFIHEKRKAFLERFIPLVNTNYERIAGIAETIGLQYESPLLTESFPRLLLLNRDKDFALQRTCAGIHKDDLSFLLGSQPFRSIASQGQRKSLLFALKLAEFAILCEEKGFPPLLLLDDVFEKLDEDRMRNLLHWVCVENDAQVFITDTHRERLEGALAGIGADFGIVELGG